MPAAWFIEMLVKKFERFLFVSKFGIIASEVRFIKKSFILGKRLLCINDFDYLA